MVYIRTERFFIWARPPLRRGLKKRGYIWNTHKKEKSACSKKNQTIWAPAANRRVSGALPRVEKRAGHRARLRVKTAVRRGPGTRHSVFVFLTLELNSALISGVVHAAAAANAAAVARLSVAAGAAPAAARSDLVGWGGEV